MRQNGHSVAGVEKLADLYDADGERLYLNPEERLRFFEAIEGIEDLKHRSLCMALLYTGCRPSEAVSLRSKNVDVADKTLVFKTLKQKGKTIRRALPVPNWLIELLLQQAPSGSDAKLWDIHRSTALRWVKKHAKDIGLHGKRATCKGLRHAFAIDNVSQGVPLSTISKWLGHAKLENTKIYLNFVGPEERALAQRAWPHLRSKLPPVSVTPATSVTEVKNFSFDGDNEKAEQAMNTHIKNREAEGWRVSQMEQLTGYDEYDGRKYPYTVGMMVVFVKETQAVRDW